MLSIGRLADAGGVGVETVRFYQRKALIDVPAQTGGIRRYGDEDVRRLRFIRKAQKAGFTLEEIKELLDLDAGHDHHRAHELATSRIAKLDEQIAELHRARECLQTLSKECAGGSSGPCPILSAFDV